MEAIKKEKMYKCICEKIGIDLIDHLIWCEKKKKEYGEQNGWHEDDRSQEEVDKDIYGNDYKNVLLKLNIEEIEYVDKIFMSLVKKGAF